MGYWGAGLYSGDFAQDLRAAVAAVSRLPLGDEELVAALKASEARAATDPADPDHTTFWLVAADQFARRGVYPEEVRVKALAIITDSVDLERLKALGAGDADLRRRTAKLSQIASALAERAPRPRRTLAAPQAFVMQPGEVLVYPTSGGRPINPYYKAKALIRGWSQDGWGAAVVASAERAFGWLAWYRVMTPNGARASEPGLDSLWEEPQWEVRAPGTCSPSHFRRLELARIGQIEIDQAALDPLFARLPSGRSAAVSDISLANNLSLTPARYANAATNSRRAWAGSLSAVAKPLGRPEGA